MSGNLSPGIVFLVGAGPGDPALITVRGMQLLEEADVVVYDHLANPRLLRYCPRARAIYVGKQASSHSMQQEQINALLVDEARAGRRVVRLKGGDPFVFGRGGEECLALAAAKIPYEIVPGITAAVAVPAYAGIPITHRDLNSSVTFITGHESSEDSSDIPWHAMAKMPCLAFYMGVGSLPKICRRLIDNGMSPDTPAATIQWGTTPMQKTVTSTLADLPVAAAALGPPALTIIGKVVSLRQTLAWFENRPLFGKTIVVTRTRDQASDLSRRLESLGAAVLEAPTIELAPAADSDAVDAAIKSAANYHWIIFTSANGVTAAKDRLRAIGGDIRLLGHAKIAAIGAATAAAVWKDLCLNVDLCPTQFVAEALADELLARNEIAGRRFLLLRADIARPMLPRRLREFGAAEVCDIALYQTLPASSLPAGLEETLDRGEVHWITFTSSSTARNFTRLLGADYRRRLNAVKIASIGPITTQTLVELELTPTVQATTFDINGLVQAILAST